MRVSPPAEGNRDVQQIQEDLPQEKEDNRHDPEGKKTALRAIIADYNQQYGTKENGLGGNDMLRPGVDVDAIGQLARAVGDQVEKAIGAALAARRSARAELAGACNTLRFDGDGIFGDNTDGCGLVADIERNAGVALAGRDVLLVGAGGAAAGVLGPLLEARPRRIVVANRTVEKAQALVQRLLAQAG